MKRILVASAGGSPAVNFTRSLRKAPEEFHLVGTDADKYHLMRAETDTRYLVPSVTAEPALYLMVINEIIAKEQIDFIHAQADAEVSFLSENRARILAKTLLPKEATVAICQDKFRSFEKWKAAGIKVPRTILIRSRNDLEEAFAALGGKMWLRAISGAGGRGALPVCDVGAAASWLDLHKGWNDTFIAAELLEKDSTTWMSLWHEGKLVVAQGRRRLYWELGRISPSGVTGATGAGETVSDPVLDGIAQAAVLAVDQEPEGLFGVDLTYDKELVPNPTEINVGRFFTTHQFFTELGVNMPYIFVKIAFDEKVPPIAKKLNPAPNDMVWIRGMDFEPVLTSRADIERNVAELERMRRRLETIRPVTQPGPYNVLA